MVSIPAILNVHPIQMAGVETIWELHTLPVINSWCTISTSTQSTATHEPMVFPTCFQMWWHMGPQTCCVLSHSDTCNRDYFPLQWSLQTAILAGSDPCPLSCYRPLVATFALLETHTLLALSTLLWTSLAIQQSTSLPSCLLGKNIFRVILLEW